MKEEGYNYLEINTENQHDYYKICDKLAKFTETDISVNGTSRDPLTIIIETENLDDVDEEEESSEASE